MPFVSFANTALVEMVYTWNGVVVENTLYFRGDAAWNGSTLGELGNEIFEWWDAEIKALQPTTCTLQAIKLRDMSTQFGAYNEYAPIAGNVGVNVSPSLPNNVTAAIKFTTALIGRRNRGRNFVVGLVESGVSGSLVDSSYAALWVDAYEDLQVQPFTNGAVHVIASRATAVAPDYNGVTTLVTGYSMDLRIDTQRRRLT